MNDLIKTDKPNSTTEAAGQTEFALLACPFCGEKHSLWEYICSTAAQIRCGGCGIKLPGSEVRTVYLLDEDLPDWAVVLAKKQECIKIDGVIKEAWWVKPTDSFIVLGHMERWNTRAS